LPEILTSRVQTPLILESVCVIYCRLVATLPHLTSLTAYLAEDRSLHSKHYTTIFMYFIF